MILKSGDCAVCGADIFKNMQTGGKVYTCNCMEATLMAQRIIFNKYGIDMSLREEGMEAADPTDLSSLL